MSDLTLYANRLLEGPAPMLPDWECPYCETDGHSIEDCELYAREDALYQYERAVARLKELNIPTPEVD